MTFSVLVLVGPVIAIGMMIDKWTTEIVITSRRFVYKRGWIVRRTEEIGLGKLEEINLDQSILGRIFGYGKLRLSGTGVSTIKLPAIDDPLSLRRAIDRVKAGAQKSAAAQ